MSSATPAEDGGRALVRCVMRQVVERCANREAAGPSLSSPAPELEPLFDLFSREENSELVVEGGGLEELLLQLNANIHCRTLAAHALGCLWNFAMISGHGLVFCLQGGLQVLGNVLQHHSGQIYIHARALTVLMHVVTTSEYIEDAHVDSILGSVMLGLRLWGQDKYICDVAFGTLSCLIEKRRASAQAIVQMNAVPLLVDTLGWLVTQCQLRSPTSSGQATPYASRVSCRPCSYPHSTPRPPTPGAKPSSWVVANSPAVETVSDSSHPSSPTPHHETPTAVPPTGRGQGLPSVDGSNPEQDNICTPTAALAKSPDENSSSSTISPRTAADRFPLHLPTTRSVGLGERSTQCLAQLPLEGVPRIVDDKQSREVLFKALHCIFQLTCCDSAKLMLCSCQAPQVLVQCLRSFPTCERVCLASCGALWNLAMLEHNRTPMRQAGCLEALLSVLSPATLPGRGSRHKLVLRAATALYHLSRFHDENLSHIVRHEGCEAVVAATREFSKDVNVLQMLSLLLLRLSGRHATELVEAGVVDVVTSLLAEHSVVESVCSNCCGLLWNLSMVRQGGPRDVRTEIGEKGGVVLLLQAIRQHPAHTEILCRAFTGLWNLLDVEHNIASFLAHNGLELALQVVQQRQHDCDLISLVWGCLFLLLLKSPDVTLRERMIEMWAIEGLLDSLTTHYKSQKFCEKAFELILRFSIGGAVRIVQSDGVPRLLQGMREHAANERVVAAACGSIWNLAMHDSCRVALMEHHVVNSLTEAMSGHPHSTVIQFRAITALFKLSTSVADDIVSTGGIRWMAQACLTHRHDGCLVANVLGTLWNIAMVSDANRLIVGQHMGDILASIDAHYQHDDVQHRGSTLLFHLFQNNRNRQSFVSRAVCADPDLGLRVLFKLIHHLCVAELADRHSETVYFCLTSVVLLLKDDVARTHVLEQILTSKEPPPAKKVDSLVVVVRPHPIASPAGEEGAAGGGEESSLYLQGLRRALLQFHSHTRNSGRCAQILFWLSQQDAGRRLIPWLLNGPAPTMAKVFAQVIRNNTLDSTRCNLIDCLCLSCGGAEDHQLRQLRDTEGLFPAITSHLVSPHTHVRSKVRALLAHLAPADVDVLCYADLDRLLVATQRSFVYAPSPPSPSSTAGGTPEGPCSPVLSQQGLVVPEQCGQMLARTPLPMPGSADSVDCSVPCHKAPPTPHQGLCTDSSVEQIEDDVDSVARALPCIDTSLVASDADPQPSPLGFTAAAPRRCSPPGGGGLSADAAASQWEALTTPQCPTAAYSDDRCCSVCLEEYVAGDEVTEYVCGHRFHRLCLEHWLQDSFVCPCCRMPVTAVLSDAATIKRLRALLSSGTPGVDPLTAPTPTVINSEHITPSS
eukprot:GGOE01018401.1.p1 GENE.GGOE01018401.1~~GGOE01018401.1.p1  ORF type:complete len:1386 (-),score=408.52 GGOE01018401.1:620-4714(-)